MTRNIRVLLAAACLLSQACGQNFSDGFNYLAGTTIPGYTEQRGDWIASGTNVQAQAGVAFQELSLDGITDTDCCVEMTARYNIALPSLQYAGPMARYIGSGATASYFMIKVQDNGGNAGFNTWWAYYYSAGVWQSFMSGTIAPAVYLARVRLQVNEVAPGVRVQIWIDTDLDGRWNINSEATTNYGIGTSGKVGVCAYGSSFCDDLKYFAATLFPNALPTIGSSMTLLGRSVPNFPYLAAASLGHSGFPAPSGGIIPLDYDWMFNLSLTTPAIFSNFSGFTAADGGFVLTLNIPPLPALSGLPLWISALTHNGLTDLEISPDTQVIFL